MIRPLRQRHRLVFVLLALIVPPLLAAALLTRPATPVASTIAQSVPTPDSVVTERVQSWAGGSLRTQFLRRDGHYVVRVQLTGAESVPELLLYWDPTAAPDADGIPEDGRLIGSLAGSRARQFDLEPQTSRGRLILYDLARKRTLTSFELALQSDPPEVE